MKKLCLASQSKSRRDVLADAHIRFDIVPSNIPEIFEGERPEKFVRKLALQKGESILEQTDAPLVVSCDSVAVIDGKIIGKPKNEEDAISILGQLQGKTHRFLTGISVIDVANKTSLQRVVSTRVTLSSMEPKLIQLYVHKFKPFRFAGGYDNSLSSWFIESIEGSISNLKGMPMTDLREMLEDLGHQWFEFVE